MKITLLPRQREILQSDARFIVCACGRRFGKALWIETPIITTDGFKPIKCIDPGDYVFDESGNPVEVEYRSEVYHDRPCYEVVFSDGTVIVADGDHEWVTLDQNYRKNVRRQHTTSYKPTLHTTEEIKDTLTIQRNDTKIQHNHAVRVCKPINFSTKEQSIDPYLLGVWLGDGTTYDGSITTNDDEILNAFRERGYRVGQPESRKGSITYTIFTPDIHDTGKWRGRNKTFLKELKDAGVLNNKHIPKNYLFGNVNQRKELLKGLMDTDGYISTKGYAEYTSCDEKLANDVYSLILSLGVKATLNIYDAKLYGKVTGKKYRIHFTPVFNPFKLTRKSERFRKPKKPDVNRRFIVDVRRVESVPVCCIATKGKSHLFLAGERFIPTHNSQMSAFKVVMDALKKPDGVYWLVSPTYPQTKIIWRMIKRFLPKAYIKTIREGELYIELANGSTIWAKSGDNPDNLRGEGLNGVILDECAMLKPDVWNEAIRPALGDKQGWAIFISTPKGKNWFYELFLRGIDTTQNRWKSYQYPTWENPIISQDEIDEMKRSMPDIKYRQEILAEFLDAGGEVFRGLDRVITAKRAEPVPGRYYLAGVDLGRHEDFTVIKVADTLEMEEVYSERFNKADWDYIKQRIREVCQKYNRCTIMLDSTGYGDPIYEDLAKEGLPINGININVKTKPEMIENLQLLIENQQIKLLDDRDTLLEFGAFTYEQMPSGHIRYSAPKGFHDDCVMAAALMAYGLGYGGCSAIGVIEDDDIQPEHDYDEIEDIVKWYDDEEEDLIPDESYS